MDGSDDGWILIRHLDGRIRLCSAYDPRMRLLDGWIRLWIRVSVYTSEWEDLPTQLYHSN